MTESVRVDKWLWAVRGFRSRTSAGKACSSGQVRVNGETAKPSTRVVVGDRVQARRGQRLLVFEVVEVIDKRVSAVRAAECYEDFSPPPEHRAFPDAIPVGMRDPGAGRPTKRDRRMIEKLRGRD